MPKTHVAYPAEVWFCAAILKRACLDAQARGKHNADLRVEARAWLADPAGGMFWADMIDLAGALARWLQSLNGDEV